MADRLGQVRNQIAAAARKAARNPAEISLLAVSKTFPEGPIREAFAAGQTCFGENRVQEAHEKLPRLADLKAEWHLIGHLQANKARRAVELFDVIQTLDSVKIAHRAGRIAADLNKKIRVYVQVDIGAEEQKSGIAADDLDRVVDAVLEQSHLQLEGLMCIPPWNDNPEVTRPYFRRLAGLLEALNRRLSAPLRGLSMGMSNDFAVAIEEGSTLVRVGTAIFGSRRTPQP